MRYLVISCFLILQCGFLKAQVEAARNHIAILASDSLAGRAYVDDGLAKAANYISSQLMHDGITHTKQVLSYPVNAFPGNIHFSTSLEDRQSPFIPGKHFLIHPSSGSIDFKNKSWEELNIEGREFEGIKLKTKKIYTLLRTKENAETVNDFISFFLEEANIKKSLLIVQDSSKLTWFPSQLQSKNSVIFLKKELHAAPVTAKWDAKFIKQFSTSNILAKIQGKRSDSVLMFSAHYDHLGRMGKEATFYGANDNASGVAMLLSLSHHFTDNMPEFDTYLLFTTGEEIGLLGSYYFIQNPLFDLRKIKMLINLDMVGTGQEGITIVNSKKNPAILEKMRMLNKEDRLKAINERGEACNSDHCLFDQVGVPAVFIYTLGGRQAYHDVEDEAEGLSLHAFNSLHDMLIELCGVL